MPMYDLCCTNQHVQTDRWLKLGERPPCPECGEPTATYWKEQRRAVISDEIDIKVRHGLCNPDGTPRHFRSRAELRWAEQRAGMTNYVEHKGLPGGDKSPHTSRWV